MMTAKKVTADFLRQPTFLLRIDFNFAAISLNHYADNKPCAFT
jgi:hypothetical protein